MKRKNQAAKRALLMGAPLPWLADGKPPTEFCMFRAGENQSDYGPIMFDARAAQAVMASQQAKGNPLFFDWNHGMTIPKDKRTREQGASAGRFSLEIREGELWAVNCQWNEDGADDLTKRRYELFSPYFTVSEDEQGVLRPDKVINCAILNLAGLNDLEPLAAGAVLDNEGEATMNEAEIKALQDRAAKAEAEVIALRGKTSVMALAAVVGVTDEAQVSAAVTGLVKIRTDILALTAQTEPAAAIGVVKGWKESHGKVVEITAENDKRTAVALGAEFDALVASGVKELRIDPAEVESVRKFALAGYGGKVTKEAVAEFAAYLPTRAARGSTPGAGAKQPKGATGREPMALSADQVAMLERHGIKKETGEKAMALGAAYRAHKAKELEGSDAGAAQ